MTELKKDDWTTAEIRSMLQRSEKAVSRAVLALYEEQTADEQRSNSTRNDNGRGFNQADARYLSYCAKWIMQNGKLTRHHVDKARQRVNKYARQLAKLANKKAISHNTHAIEMQQIREILPAQVEAQLEARAHFGKFR